MALSRNSPPASGQVSVNRPNRLWAYSSAPPRNVADFLELAENYTFLYRKLSSALNEIVDGDGLTLKELNKANE